MAGWIVSVTTVSQIGPEYRRERHVEVRKPCDADAGDFLIWSPNSGICGPCGALVPAQVRSAFEWTITWLGDYAVRWGDAPLGVRPMRERRAGHYVSS